MGEVGRRAGMAAGGYAGKKITEGDDVLVILWMNQKIWVM